MENISRFVVYQDARSQWCWKLQNQNGSVTAMSPRDGYATKQNCLNELVAVKRMVGEAEVVDA